LSVNKTGRTALRDKPQGRIFKILQHLDRNTAHGVAFYIRDFNAIGLPSSGTTTDFVISVLIIRLLWKRVNPIVIKINPLLKFETLSLVKK